MSLRRTLTLMVSTAALAAVAAAQVKIEKASAKPTNPTSGKEMFQTYCAVCHGNDAKGTGPAAAALRKAPADLTRLSARNGGTFPEMQVAQYIEGQEIVAAHGSRDMPIWGDVFRSMSRDAGTDHLRVVNLTNYLKTIQAQ